MSNLDNLDLMKFIALGDTITYFCQCQKTIYIHHQGIHSKVESDVNDEDFLSLLRKCVDQNQRTFRENAQSFAQLIKKKLINWKLNGPMIWFDQFKLHSQTLLGKANAYLPCILPNDIKVELQDKNYICKLCWPEVFMVENCKKDQWLNSLGSLNEPYWKANFETLKKYLSWNTKCASFSFLPILLCLQDEEEVTFKIGILREVHNNSRIIWIQRQFSQDIDSVNDWRISDDRNGKFVLLKYVFENMMHHLFKRREEQKSKIFGDTAKYIALIVTNLDFSCLQEKNIINNCLPNEWLNQNQDETIFILFTLSCRCGPLLGIAEVTDFYDSQLFLNWYKISSHGIKLANDPKVKEQLDDHCYIIENGRDLVVEYQRIISEPNDLKRVRNVEPPKKINQHAQTSLEDIYLAIEAGGEFSIQYFVFIPLTRVYDSELTNSVNKNLQIFDKNALNLIFIITERLDCICCLQMLTFKDGYKMKDLLNLSINFCHQITEVSGNKGTFHPCGNGRELFKLYYECSNQRPANLRNIGNSCYLASMIQCLKVCFEQDDLEYGILSNEKTPLSLELFKTLNMMSSPQISVMATDLRSEIGKYSKKFGTDSQQDGFEFLMYLMNKVEKELREFETDHTRSKGLSKDVFKGKFAFEIQATWKCKAGHVGNSCQMDYAVHISPHASGPDGADLKNCWRGMFDKEEEEQIFCQECPEKERIYNGKLKRTIKNLPEILIIYINRLDFNKYLKNNVNLRFELDDFEVKYSGGSGNYTVVAFCEHIGSLITGHYRACVRGTKHNVWFLCDDLKDEHEAIIYEKNYMTSRNVYTIFYRKQPQNCEV